LKIKKKFDNYNVFYLILIILPSGLNSFLIFGYSFFLNAVALPSGAHHLKVFFCFCPYELGKAGGRIKKCKAAKLKSLISSVTERGQ
jgi:hypothetical protein